MATTQLCGVVFVLLCASPVFGGTDLAVAVAGNCPASDAVLRTAMSESVRIWSAADVNLKWMSPAQLPYAAAASGWLVVQCVARNSPMLQSSESHLLPIAAIRFIDSRPTNALVVSIENAKSLLDRDVADSRDMSQRFKPLKDLRLGRVIGRAIAHEIGHFVRASGAHTPSGLMRATHPVRDLIGASLYPFKVERGDLAQQMAAATLARSWDVAPGSSAAARGTGVPPK